MLHRPCANRQADRLSYGLLCFKAPCHAWFDTTRGSAGEEAGTKLGDKCRYGVPASGPEVRTNMTWGMGWMNYHYLLSLEVAASDLGPVRSPLLTCVCMIVAVPVCSPALVCTCRQTPVGCRSYSMVRPSARPSMETYIFRALLARSHLEYASHSDCPATKRP